MLQIILVIEYNVFLSNRQTKRENPFMWALLLTLPFGRTFISAVTDFLLPTSPFIISFLAYDSLAFFLLRVSLGEIE